MSAKERENITVWRPPELPALEFKRGVGVKRPYPKHWHSEFQICLIQSGAGDLCYKGSKHFTDEGKLFIMPPEEVHANNATHSNGCSSLSLYFDPQFSAEVARKILDREIAQTSLSSIVSENKKLVHSFVRLHNSFSEETSLLERESMLLEFFAEMLLHCSDAQVASNRIGREKKSVERVKEILFENFSENISLNFLAGIANMSPFHLNRVFKKETGLPPHAFQNQVRVLQAKKLLHQGLSLAHIAAETGFADQSHLTRHFKRLMGVTPGQYTQKSKNIQDMKIIHV